MGKYLFLYLKTDSGHLTPVITVVTDPFTAHPIWFLSDVLHRLLTDNEFYNSIINNIKKAAINNGVEQVSDYILKFQ